MMCMLPTNPRINILARMKLELFLEKTLLPFGSTLSQQTSKYILSLQARFLPTCVEAAASFLRLQAGDCRYLLLTNLLLDLANGSTLLENR